MNALDDFNTDHHFRDSYNWSAINAARKKLSTIFKKQPGLDVMIINFENAASHKCAVRTAKSL